MGGSTSKPKPPPPPSPPSQYIVMGGSNSKPAPLPPPSPSPPPRRRTSNQSTFGGVSSQTNALSSSLSRNYSSVSSTTTTTSTLFSSSSASQRSSTLSTSGSVSKANANSNARLEVSVIPANVSVAHPANNYKIPNVIKIDSRPKFNLELNSPYARRGGNIKIERYVMTICPQHLSKEGCSIQYCYRFHVCQFWIRGTCNKHPCQYDHGFHSMDNKCLFEVLQSKRFDEQQMVGTLKRNMFRGNEMVRVDNLIICIEFIFNRCKRENCKHYHIKSTFLWQININNKWVGFPQSMNDQVEKLFTVPSNTKCLVNLQKKGRRGTPKVNPIFLSNSLEVDFDKMTLLSKGSIYKIRRLSTESDVKKFQSLATRWLWFWEDDFGGWNFYNNAILKDSDMVIIPFSDYLETEYLKNKNVVFFKFSEEFTHDINFFNMEQTNQVTGKRRRIRRRPMPKRNKSSWNENTTIRNLWSISNDSSEKFIRTTVTPQSPEYLYFRRMIEKTLPLQTFSLERIENIYLWETYQIKKAQMLASYSNNTDALSEQYLFHGTSKSVVDKICAQNLDWRLYGTNVGNVYGKGTYFSSSASLSNSYASFDEGGFKWMFIILVLVGKACSGHSSIVIPPVNPSTKIRYDSTVESAINPTIFVKYNLDDYVPAYIVKYS